MGPFLQRQFPEEVGHGHVTIGGWTWSCDHTCVGQFIGRFTGLKCVLRYLCKGVEQLLPSNNFAIWNLSDIYPAGLILLSMKTEDGVGLGTTLSSGHVILVQYVIIP